MLVELVTQLLACIPRGGTWGNLDGDVVTGGVVRLVKFLTDFCAFNDLLDLFEFREQNLTRSTNISRETLPGLSYLLLR